MGSCRSHSTENLAVVRSYRLCDPTGRAPVLHISTAHRTGTANWSSDVRQSNMHSAWHVGILRLDSRRQFKLNLSLLSNTRFTKNANPTDSMIHWGNQAESTPLIQISQVTETYSFNKLYQNYFKCNYFR